MADIAGGTQFSDLPSYLVIDILLRLPLKTLLICRYVRKDWMRLYFSDPYFIKRQLQTSNIQFLSTSITKERKFRFGSFVEDEVSTDNLRMETLEPSCKFLPDPEHDWRVVNSCNGLVCLVDRNTRTVFSRIYVLSIYVCNPILGEWVCIPFPNLNINNLYDSCCALGFSAKDNQYKILLCNMIGEEHSDLKYEWEIYTLGTGHWRSIETKENIDGRYFGHIEFNSFIHGSIHWAHDKDDNTAFVLQSFNFEMERFSSLLCPELVREVEIELGVINGCLWASSFYTHDPYDVEIWAMKEYGIDKPWTMMLALRDEGDTPDEVYFARNNELVIHYLQRGTTSCYNKLLFTLNEDEMLISDDWFHKVIGYNFKTKRSREMMVPEHSFSNVTAYNPSFVSLPDFERAEQVIRELETS